MISYSRKQKALEELAELNKISEQKKKEQEEQKAIELFREQTKDIHTTKGQSIEEIKQWCGNKTFTEKLYDFIFCHFMSISLILTTIIISIFVIISLLYYETEQILFAIPILLLLYIAAVFVVMLNLACFLDSLEHKIPSLINKIKTKTLDVNYLISENTIDCPIEIKKELLYELKSGYVYIRIDLESRHQRRQFSFITEDGEVNTYNTDFDNVYNDEIWYDLYYSKELCYFANQLKDGTMYRISDIITDRGVK